jgi:hypothetical protein
MTTYSAEVLQPIYVSLKGQDGPAGPSIDFELKTPGLVGVLAQVEGSVADPGVYPFNLGLVLLGGSLTGQIMQFQQSTPMRATSVPGKDAFGFPGGSWYVAPLPAGMHTVRLQYMCQRTTATFLNRRLWVTIFD